MDYFIYDTKIRLEEVEQELVRSDLTNKDKNILSEKKNSLLQLLDMYNTIKTKLHKNNLETSIEFVK